ncbi:MAG TPA: SRPBCC family protein [Thermoanaerobaculia bacterium]
MERSQLVAAPLSEVFAFFSDAGNLARITPPWLRFRIHGDSPAIAPGARIEYRIRWLVFTLRWVTRITRFTPPREFQDVQEKGPYRAWIHTHTFAQEAGGVRMTDRVEYALPLGAAGRLAHAVVVRRQLEGIFAYRRRAVDEIFGRLAPPAAS